MQSVAVPEQIRSADLKSLSSFTQADLCFSLSRFIHEVKRHDGGDYPPNTIREIIIMIQMYLQKNSIMWKLFDHLEF